MLPHVSCLLYFIFLQIFSIKSLNKRQSLLGGIMDWFGDNAKEVEMQKVEDTFKNNIPILLENEKVQMSFQSGRDYTVMTDKRFLTVDVQGLMGYKSVITTVLWKSIDSYAVQTAGSWWDRDMEMKLYTNIMGMEEIPQDFRHGKADLFAIQRVLCNHILGPDTNPMTDVIQAQQTKVNAMNWWWFKDNQRPLDAVEMNQVYHTSPPLLRGNEQVEMAFKGWRDITLFTNLRVVIIDPKALTGKRVEYTSLPWKTIVAHAVRTAGKYVDFDTEVCFWTEKDYKPGSAGSGENDPPTDPEPYVSYLYVFC